MTVLVVVKGVTMTQYSGTSELCEKLGATHGAKTSIFDENFWGELVSTFTVALIKQVACMGECKKGKACQSSGSA